jgi:putative PEP-CTERM system histidine kinase
MIVTLVSYGAAAIAFAVFTALTLLGGRITGPAIRLVVASGLTAFWATSVIVTAVFDDTRSLADLLLETARSAAWIAFLHGLLLLKVETSGPLASRWTLFGATTFCISLIAADAAYVVHPMTILALYDVFARIVIAIVVLILLENLVRNDRPSGYWSTKFVFAGLGGIFAYDLFLYSEALLFQRVNVELYVARGLVNAIAVPLMAIAIARNPLWAVDIHVSRQFVFHSFTLFASGSYLLLMGVAGYYLRSFGGDWGTLLQVGFFSAALVLVFLTLSSLTFRSLVRRFISLHFFSYKYDYRHEWLQFIRMLSAQGSFLHLRDRVVQAIADILDSPAGGLWTRDGEDARFVNKVAWNTPLLQEHTNLGRAVVDYFEQTGMPLHADGQELSGQRVAAPEVPAWIRRIPRAWLVVPLIHRDGLLGFVLLTAPRAPQQLTLEDYELLTLVGRQCASYLAEEEAGKALNESRQLEAFNRRFAFVVHDIKNLASQLSLVLKNAERHIANPEFQRDALATVRHSVNRMNTILEQLSAERRKGANAGPVELGGLIAREWSGAGRAANLETEAAAAPLVVETDPEQVLRVLRHLVQNALDAVGDKGHVRIALAEAASEAVIRITDNGPGMSAEFIRDHLFRPFDSTKQTGYGIGAYQARQIVKELGGRLEVASEPGRGTEFRIFLPVARNRAAMSPQAQTA